jgi:hypothetical protein
LTPTGFVVTLNKYARIGDYVDTVFITEVIDASD